MACSALGGKECVIMMYRCSRSKSARRPVAWLTWQPAQRQGLVLEIKRVTAPMLRPRWDDAREEAVKEAVAAGDQVVAGRISQFQLRDIRPKRLSRSPMLTTPACYWATPRATLPSEFIVEYGA
jgi:hypothetical protein